MSKEMKALGMVVWVITAIASLNVGLNSFGWGLMTWGFLSGLPWLVVALQYLVGISGVISLLMWLKSLGGGHCPTC